MGMRLHYQKFHEIRYGQAEDFNHQQQAIDDLLARYRCHVYPEDGDAAVTPRSFRVPRKDILRMIKRLERRVQEKVLFCRFDGFGDQKWTVRDVLSFFRSAYEGSPKDEEDIFFDWF